LPTHSKQQSINATHSFCMHNRQTVPDMLLKRDQISTTQLYHTQNADKYKQQTQCILIRILMTNVSVML